MIIWPYSLKPLLKAQLTASFRNQSAISYFDTTGEEALVKVIVSGYGTAATTLNAETVYYLSGRFIARLDITNEQDPYVFYDQELTLNIGNFDNIPAVSLTRLGSRG
ncbi:hypothetical protein H4Q26_012132 [Puccinia striiformis f. sp. tritici PST-130]|nr:hypothetical protein H4Q26_012132 [Puccinia striiformis f. sp. tritici PST-130]